MRSPHVVPVSATKDAPSHYCWVASRPILRDPLVLRQLGLVFIISLAVLLVIMAIIQWPWDQDTLRLLGGITLITGAIFLVLLPIGVAVIAAGGYQVEYRLDDEGIGGRPYGRTARKNAVVNILLVLSGQPWAMGAGMLAQSRQAEYAAWKDVDRVETDPRQRTITLYRVKRPLMVVACDEDHYERVLDAARTAVGRGA